RVVELALVRWALGANPCRPLRHVPRLGGVETEAEAIADLAVLRHDARDERFLASGEAQRLHVAERYRNGVSPLRRTRPWSSRPRVCSQNSAVASSPSRLIPVLMPIDSNRLTRSSVQTLPVKPSPYFTFAGWPPTPPKEESKWRTPAS